MRNVRSPVDSAGDPTNGKLKPRYEVIRDTLRDSLTERRMATGVVLLEGPIANIFGTSRAPVRKALDLLHAEGLISRFEGRGYIAARPNETVAPLRTVLSRATLGLDRDDAAMDKRPAADRIFPDVEQTVATCITFGHFRLIESALSDYYSVSRTVVRQVLSRLRDRGLVEKDPHAHWLAGPLTARSVAEDYEIRALLEPNALKASAPYLDHRLLQGMRQRLVDVMDGNRPPTPALMAAVEQDLHVVCLRHADNRKAASIIRQSQLPIMVNSVFSRTLGATKDEALFMEHKLVIDHLLRDALDAAASSLEAHLRAAAKRTMQRLKVLSVFPEPPLPAYLVRIA